MTDPVPFLRGCDDPLMQAAAAEIQRLRGDNTEHRLRETAMRYEIESLQHMQANLHGHIKRLEDANQKLEQENAKLREALAGLVEVAGGGPGFFDKIAIARAALQKDESPLLKWKGAFTFAQKDEGE